MENPYASPERMTEEVRWSRQDRALVLTWIGLGWMLMSASCSLGLYVAAGGAFLVLLVSVGKAFFVIEMIGACSAYGLLGAAGLSVFPGVWRCWGGMSGLNVIGRDFLSVTWTAWAVGGLLMCGTIVGAFWLVPLGVIALAVSFWHWYRYLEFVAWKNRQPGMMRLAFFMFVAAACWCGVVLMIMLLAFLDITMNRMYAEPFILPPLAILAVCLPAVYQLLEIVVLRGLRLGIQGLLELPEAERNVEW